MSSNEGWYSKLVLTKLISPILIFEMKVIRTVVTYRVTYVSPDTTRHLENLDGIAIPIVMHNFQQLIEHLLQKNIFYWLIPHWSIDDTTKNIMHFTGIIIPTTALDTPFNCPSGFQIVVNNLLNDCYHTGITVTTRYVDLNTLLVS